MALTQEEKDFLDERLLEFFAENNEIALSSTEIARRMEYKYHIDIMDGNIIRYSFNRLLKRFVNNENYIFETEKRYDYFYGKKANFYNIIISETEKKKYIKTKINNKFIKDKNIIKFVNVDNNEKVEFTYNCITKKFSTDIDKIKKEYIIYNYPITILDNFVLLLDTYEAEWILNYITHLSQIESVLQYIKETDETKELKGFKKFYEEKETNQYTIYTLLKEYYELNQLTDAEYKKYKIFIESKIITISKLLEIKNANKLKELDNIYKSYLLSCKSLDYRLFENYYQNLKGIITYFIEAILFYQEFFIDSNRDLRHNRDEFQNYIDREKNILLEKQLKKLNIINNMIFDDYIVIVPQSQREKQEEGRQQNNCVGSYYDDTIISGDNYIYFLRKKNDHKKSYITCRYNKSQKSTVEYRYKNNVPVTKKTEIEIFQRIDEIINNIEL